MLKKINFFLVSFSGGHIEFAFRWKMALVLTAQPFSFDMHCIQSVFTSKIYSSPNNGHLKKTLWN